MFRPTSSWACWVPPTRICVRWRASLTADIHVRGNALTMSGEPADVALAERVSPS